MFILISAICIIGLIIGGCIAGLGGLRRYGLKDKDGKVGWGILMFLIMLSPEAVVLLSFFGVSYTFMISQMIFACDALMLPAMTFANNPDAFKNRPFKKACAVAIIVIGIISGIKIFLSVFSLPSWLWKGFDAVYLIAKTVLLF